MDILDYWEKKLNDLAKSMYPDIMKDWKIKLVKRDEIQWVNLLKEKNV